ncbi:MAG: response regulator [Desulfobacterales bacterium]|nr:response regulator [Desulfobacteraceae bacterium]MDD3992983.1 response regulator [Desulfobacteraceae bacterium]MDY0311823.1 response regulator [Desulfobacterales bacterium]
MSHGCPRILVVDDDPDMRVFLSTVLTEGGFKPVVAAGGLEGLRLAGACKPDLILLEARLPGRQGADVYRQLKLDPDLKRIPVIMLSLLSPKTYLHCRQIEDGRQGERLPVPEAFLAKPPEADDLLRRVRRLLGPVAPGDPVAAAPGAGHLPEP